MNTPKQNKFQPVFLYRDHEKIQSVNKQSKDWIQGIQEGLNTAKDLFEHPITDVEGSQIINGGWPVVSQMIKSKSQFPKAEPEFLLSLIGKNSESFKSSSLHMEARSKSINAVVENGVVFVDPESEAKSIKEYSYFTTSEKQNQAVKLGNEIANLIEQAIELGILTQSQRQGTANALSNLFEIKTVDEKPCISLVLRKINNI